MTPDKVRSLEDLDTGYVTIPELAQYLSVERRQVRKWIDAGSLPAIRIASIWRIHARDAKRFIASNRFRPDHRPCR